MHGAASEGVDDHGRDRGERLPLSGLHLGELSLVQGEAGDQLLVVGPQPEEPVGGLAHDREHLIEHAVRRGSGPGPLLELRRPRPQVPIVRRRSPLLPPVDSKQALAVRGEVMLDRAA